MLDLAIKGGTVVNDTGAFAADIGIEGDQIAMVTQTGGLPRARRTINADGLYVLPGVIDIHFHLRAPGSPERGDFRTETQAAAAGGVTTILEMPISLPGCARRDILEARKALGESQTYTNFGLYGAPGLLNRDEILGMAAAGACGFKVFTHAAPKGREEEFLGICIEDEGKIFQALELVKETGLITSFHAENQRLIDLFEGRMHAAGRVDPLAFIESRPTVVEAMSIAQLAVLCEATGAHVHIAHVSSEAVLEALRAGQAKRLPMTGETCPHYLFFSAGDMNDHGPFAMIKPPLRTLGDQEALWGGLFSGALMGITTDHCTYTLAEKERGLENIWQSAIGAPGVEALLPCIMTEAYNERLSLEEAVQYLSSQPAKLFQFYPQKGIIQAGADADLVLYDFTEETTIDSRHWFTQARAIDRLYHGRQVQGRVQMTLVNGQVVYQWNGRKGEIVGQPGMGRFVRPIRDEELE